MQQGHNKFLAKLASDQRKPDGLVIVEPGGEAAFLAPLELQRLWGVGPKTRELLESWGMRTIGDLAASDVAVLEARLGEHGRSIWQRAHGVDDDTVESDMAPKSVGHEYTFDRDTMEKFVVPLKGDHYEEAAGRFIAGMTKPIKDAPLRDKIKALSCRLAGEQPEP